LDNEFYESDRERWKEIGKATKNVAEYINVPQGSIVLDVLVGPGDFTRAVAKSSKGTHVIAGEILTCDIEEAKQKNMRDGLKDRIDLLRMDVTHMAFADNSFYYVVNFSGWGDFTSFSGEELIDQLFSEITRVLKPDGFLAVTFEPELEANDYVSRKDKELQEFRYMSKKRPKFFDEKFFLHMFEKYGIEFLEKKCFRTPKSRILQDEAKEILRGVDYYPSFFPEVKMRPYEEIQRKFGEFIEKYGIREYRSEFTLLIGKKTLGQMSDKVMTNK